MSKGIQNLDLNDKQTIVDLLMEVQAGRVSCRRAAAEICDRLPKKRLTDKQRTRLVCMIREGYKVSVVANRFDVNPATVWRICKKAESPTEPTATEGSEG